MSRAIEFEIKNEMGVREWFAANAERLGWAIVESRTGYPDWMLRSPEGKTLRVEAERDSANFIMHGHDPSGCDLIICWNHTAILPLPVLELSTSHMYAANEQPEDAQSAEIAKQEQERRRRFVVEKKSSFKAALAQCPNEQAEFQSTVADAIKAHSEFQQALQGPMLLANAATRKLIRKLRSIGVQIDDLHPFDLLEMVAKVAP